VIDASTNKIDNSATDLLSIGTGRHSQSIDSMKQ